MVYHQYIALTKPSCSFDCRMTVLLGGRLRRWKVTGEPKILAFWLMALGDYVDLFEFYKRL
jgi:hypothetical protein